MATEVVSVIDPGGTGDYSSLSAWEADKAGDITAATGSDEIQIAKCQCTNGNADTTAVAFSNSWKTAATEYVKIWTDPAESYRHNGTYQTGNKYRLEGAGPLLDLGSSCPLNHLAVIGLQFACTGSSSSLQMIAIVGSGAGWTYVEQSIFKHSSSGTGNQAVNNNRSNKSLYASNNVIYDYGYGILNNSGTLRASNNTIHGCGRGIYKPTDTDNSVYLYNNLVQDCAVQDFDNNGTDWEGEDYNVSSDGEDISGAHSVTGDATFWDKASDDFHLHHDDTVARAAGTDLSGDGNYPFWVDVDGETRVAWDIGADESPTDVESTIDPDGTGDYTTLAAWASDKADDLVAAHEIQIATCICSGGTSDKTAVSLSAGWATDDKHFVKIWTNPAESYRHNGTYQTGNKYRLEVSNADCFYIPSSSPCNHIKLLGLQIQLTTTWASSARGIALYGSAAGWAYVEQNVVVGDLGASTNVNSGIWCGQPGATYYLSNNIVYDFAAGTDATYGFNLRGTATVYYCFNNTAHNCRNGFSTLALPVSTIKNCLAQDCSGACFSANWDTASHNCSDDSTEPGTNGRDGEVAFADEGNDDFHLSAADTIAKGYGTDLSGDSNYPLALDIDGDERSSPWDIGADETTGTVHEGSATATGAGSSSAAAGVTRTASATATGSGSSSALAGVIRSASGTATGAGLLGAIAGVLLLGAQATATGSGSSSTAGVVAYSVQTSALGSGSSSAAGAVVCTLPPLALHSATRTLGTTESATLTITPVDSATLTLDGLDEATRGARRT